MAWQRKIPFGYQVRNGRINCHPEEAELVRAIFSRYLLGGSYSQIADEMTQQGVRYHQHNAQWNKHMVKRILENERYLGMDGYPQLVTDEEFLAVRLRRGEQNTYAPCPSEIIPIRDKAVCALCGEKMARDTKSHGRPRWRCKNPECGGSVYLDDSIILERVVQKLKVLAHSPACIQLPKAAPASTDALRIENELALCFNRADINPEYMKTLIMAAAAERYAGLTFTETYITPGGGRLPPAFAERAKALHHRLDKLLRQQRERSASQRTGALSQRELWKIPLDAKDVFRRKAPPSKRETAFYLLIDRSGSMGAGIGDGTSKLFTALATAAVLEEALKGIAYTKIVAFDGGTNAVEHCVIKDFDQKEIGSRCIDAMEQIAAGNGNKDGYSIRAAALDLAKRTERRKILMVLSDGLPSGYFSEAEAIDDVRTAVQAARRRGLLVIPIIYTARTDENVDAYRRMYEKSMIFADSVGMLGEFERLLMKLVR